MLAIFEHIDAIHRIAYEVAEAILTEMGVFSPSVEVYFRELQQFSLLRKQDPLSTASTEVREFHFDFVQLLNGHFLEDPLGLHVPDGVELEVYHAPKQVDLIRGYVGQYGTDVIGLSRIVLRANMNRLYRTVRKVDAEDEGQSGAEGTNRRSNLKLIA